MSNEAEEGECTRLLIISRKRLSHLIRTSKFAVVNFVGVTVRLSNFTLSMITGVIGIIDVVTSMGGMGQHVCLYECAVGYGGRAHPSHRSNVTITCVVEPKGGGVLEAVKR